MGEGEPISDVTRQLSSPLLLGMLTAPTLFVWFFLRRRYRSSLRRAAFSYAGILFGVGLIGGLGGR
ncbi:MAG: hypothetical protein ABI471_03310 [Sphingomonas bacterium]